MFLIFVFLLSGARNRLQDLPLPQRGSDGVSGGAAEMQVQTGQTGGLRVVRTPSLEGNHGEDTRSECVPTLIRATLTTLFPFLQFNTKRSFMCCNYLCFSFFLCCRNGDELPSAAHGKAVRQVKKITKIYSARFWREPTESKVYSNIFKIYFGTWYLLMIDTVGSHQEAINEI